MREVIFESLKQYIAPVEIPGSPDKKKKGKKKDWEKGSQDLTLRTPVKAGNDFFLKVSSHEFEMIVQISNGNQSLL